MSTDISAYLIILQSLKCSFLMLVFEIYISI